MEDLDSDEDRLRKKWRQREIAHQQRTQLLQSAHQSVKLFSPDVDKVAVLPIPGYPWTSVPNSKIIRPQSAPVTKKGNFRRFLPRTGAGRDWVVGDAEAEYDYVKKWRPQFASIHEAVDVASDGDRILVLPGEYSGPLRITKRLTILGVGNAAHIQITGESSALLVQVPQTVEERVADLWRASAVTSDEHALDHGSWAIPDVAKLTPPRSFRRAQSAGRSPPDAVGAGKFSPTEGVSKGEVIGVRGPEPSCAVSNVSLCAQKPGIVVSIEQGSALLERCDVTSVGKNSTLVCVSGTAKAYIRKNKIHGGFVGVSIMEQAEAHVEENDVVACAVSNVSITTISSSCRLAYNRIYYGSVGVLVAGDKARRTGPRPTIVGNKVWGMTHNAIATAHFALPVIRRNRILGCGVGVRIQRLSSAVCEENEFASCTHAAIHVQPAHDKHHLKLVVLNNRIF